MSTHDLRDKLDGLPPSLTVASSVASASLAPVDRLEPFSEQLHCRVRLKKLKLTE